MHIISASNNNICLPQRNIMTNRDIAVIMNIIAFSIFMSVIIGQWIIFSYGIAWVIGRLAMNALMGTSKYD